MQHVELSKVPTLAVLVLFLSAFPSLLAQEAQLEIRNPEQGAAVRVLRTHTINVSGDSHVFGRSGFDLLVISPGTFDRTTLSERGTLAAIRGQRIQTLQGPWSISLTGVEPRATLGDRDPFVVITSSASGGYGSEIIRAMPLSDMLDGKSEAVARLLPTGFRSPLLVRSGIRLVATGYGYEPKTPNAVAMLPREGKEDSQNLTLYDMAGGTPIMLGIIEHFSEHAENNLASGSTRDGVIHMIATEVLVSQGNRARVHHLRFDPAKRQWLGDSIIFDRSQFTSMITPRLVTAENIVDAFWLPEGGSEKLSTDGLYARRIGEPSTWRLTDSRGEYSILPNADGHGSLLVGVAIHPSEDGKIRWFIRRGEHWKAAGETDLARTVYTLSIDGTEPFALWRDPGGGVHAAFVAETGLIVADLQIP